MPLAQMPKHFCYLDNISSLQSRELLDMGEPKEQSRCTRHDKTGWEWVIAVLTPVQVT